MDIFNKVYDFHGHVCLMSTAGIRIALAAMNAIGLKKGEEHLAAFYHAKTCAVDAIQVITGCTFGNNNITVTDERKNMLELVREDSGVGVSVTLRSEVSDRMKSCMELKKNGDPKFKQEFQELLKWLQNEEENKVVQVAAVKIDMTK